MYYGWKQEKNVINGLGFQSSNFKDYIWIIEILFGKAVVTHFGVDLKNGTYSGLKLLVLRNIVFVSVRECLLILV